MQDITPYKRPNQPAPTRSEAFGSRANVRAFYSRETRVISDVTTGAPISVETIETEIDEVVLQPTQPHHRIERLSTEAKAQALERAFTQAQKALRSEKRRNRDLKRSGLVLLASIFILVTGYVSIDTLITNNRVKAGTAVTTPAGSDGVVSAAEEGQDEVKPNAEALGKYTVAPSLPRALYIDKINVSARILPMSVNETGAIQAPRNIYDAGWYNGSVKPGEVGAMFIDGHASGPTREGLLAYLDKLAVGDEIKVEKGDGSKLTYKVVHTETVALADVDMKKMLLPYGNALRGLNLMTCTGKWLESEKTYDHRVLVWTEQV